MLKNRNFDFIANRKKFFIITLVVVAVIILASIILKPNVSIDFKGGTIISYSYENKLDLKNVKNTAKDSLGKSVQISGKYDKTLGLDSFEIALASNESIDAKTQDALTEALNEQYPDNNISEVSTTTVNPTMGKQFFLKCLVAVLFTAVLMILYIGIRFRKIGGWSAGLTSVVALLHDSFMVFGAFVLFRMDIDDNFIAVILTILGYSINDTIVVYDRIRENKRLYAKKKDTVEIVNMSLNQSITRTLMTSITTILTMLVVVVVALITGTTSILSFAVPMIVGLTVGTYSSLLLAPNLWVLWQTRNKKKKKK